LDEVTIFKSLFTHRHVDQVPSQEEELHGSTLNPHTPQVLSESEADTSYSQRQSNAIHEEIAEHTPKTEADPSYIITKCPAHEPLQLPDVQQPRTTVL